MSQKQGHMLSCCRSYTVVNLTVFYAKKKDFRVVFASVVVKYLSNEV